MVNSVDPDETADVEPSHLDLHFLHRCLFRSARLNSKTKWHYSKKIYHNFYDSLLPCFNPFKIE